MLDNFLIANNVIHTDFYQICLFTSSRVHYKFIYCIIGSTSHVEEPKLKS